MATTEQPTLVDTPAPTPKPVKLRAARDYVLTQTALEHRAGELDKLAKKAADEGYHRESRVVAADASAIRHDILPQFRAQGELPLATEEAVRAGVARRLRDVVSRAKAIKQTDDQLLEALGKRIAPYAIELARRAYAAGYASRETDPEVLATRALEALDDSWSGRAEE